MDNAAYFFTGVLAGVAALTLLAVLDNKYGMITGTPTTANDDNAKVLIIVRDRNHPDKTDEKTDELEGDKTEKSESKPNDTETAASESVQPNTELAVA